MAQRLWFQQSVEGLFLRGMGDCMTPEFKAALKTAGIDLDTLLPGYDAEVMVRCVRLAAKHLGTVGTPSDALREVGRRFMNGYRETLVGGAMVAVMGVLSTERVLRRMERNFRSGGNYIETKYTLVRPGVAELWFNEVDGVPEFFQGILLQGAAFNGRPDATVTYTLGDDGHSATFRFEFGAADEVPDAPPSSP